MGVVLNMIVNFSLLEFCQVAARLPSGPPILYPQYTLIGEDSPEISPRLKLMQVPWNAAGYPD